MGHSISQGGVGLGHKSRAQRNDFGTCALRRARVERRLRVILHDELRVLGSRFAQSMGYNGEPEIDSRGYSASGEPIAIDAYAFR